MGHYFETCTKCLANLDPGEICEDCKKRELSESNTYDSQQLKNGQDYSISNKDIEVHHNGNL